jgi:1-pyrroline-5-carboxylate dehydrogenase
VIEGREANEMDSRAAVQRMLDECGAFHNEPLTDFSAADNVRAFERALDTVRARMGEKHPLVLGGEEVWTEETFTSVYPAHPDQTVGVFSQGTSALAERAIDVASEAFEGWSRTPATERAAVLLKAAEIMRARKHELSSWMVYEVGKNWVEADADTAEAIDFLEYYARQALKLELIEVGQWPGEHDTLHYIPLGVGAVIPPWNFPVAITVGMSSAAIVAGNTVALKPASAAPKVAWEYFEVLMEAGLPDGVCNYLSGPGGVVGEYLVEHPRTRFIAFTGSKEVGLRIHELAAKTQPGQTWIKRTILEMGGKDAVVVDETADLDAAARGIVVSAFGYQGQKCSAGSRAIVVDEVYDRVLEKVLEQARELLAMGDPDRLEHYFGPVVSASQFDKVLGYIEVGKGEAKLVHGGSAADREGYFIEPTIFADVPAEARIAQEEIFGPVLSVVRARDWEQALEIANGTEFGLTGAYYSSDAERIAHAKLEFHVGNLYINRKCTGALVGIHPFGGFNMSGTDSKAGGPDYLLLFTQAKSIGEQVI